MTITTQAYIDEAIVAVTIEGPVNDEQIQIMHREILAACEPLGMCYLILDVRNTQLTIHEGMALLLANRIASLNRNGQIHPVVVGNASPDEPLNNVDYPIFAKPDEALVYVRKSLATHNRGFADDVNSEEPS